MSRITMYDPTANQLFAQGASQGAGYVNAAADNLRADEALALRQQAQQFEQNAWRDQNRQRLQREARTRAANERIFKLLKEKTPSGDLAMMSQYVGLGPTMGLPSIEQAGSMQLQGMAGQPDVFDRLLVESPDVLQDASPALVELVKDRGGQAAAARIQKINATANTLADRGLAKYARQYIQEAERLGLDPQEKMRPTKEAFAIREQERADKEQMLVDRGYQPGTPDWDREMERSYKMSLMLWNANEKKREQDQAQQQQQAEQAQRVELVGAMQSAGPLSPEQQLAIQGDPALRQIFAQVNQPSPAAPPDPQQVAQLFTRMQQGDTAARAQLIQMGQLTPSAAFSAPRDTSSADAEKRRDQMWQDSQRLMAAATAVEKTNPALAAQYAAQSRAMQQEVISSQVTNPSGPVLLSELDAQRAKMSMSDFHKQLKAKGMNPTPEELVRLWKQQTSQPQSPR